MSTTDTYLTFLKSYYDGLAKAQISLPNILYDDLAGDFNELHAAFRRFYHRVGALVEARTTMTEFPPYVQEHPIYS
jgi:hypothetical protein